MEPRPLPTIARGLRILLSGRAVFPKHSLNQILRLENGRSYRVFRQIILRPLPGDPANPQGIFRVWFHSRSSTRFTILYSWLMIPIFAGMPGFRLKFWLVDDASGDFGGIYEWNSLEDAARYANSFAMRLSKLRSLPGCFSAEVFTPADPRAQAHQPLLTHPA